MEQALRLGAEAVLRIAIAAAPDEVGALVGGRLVAPLVDVLLAGPGSPGPEHLSYCLSLEACIRAELFPLPPMPLPLGLPTPPLLPLTGDPPSETPPLDSGWD